MPPAAYGGVTCGKPEGDTFDTCHSTRICVKPVALRTAIRFFFRFNRSTKPYQNQIEVRDNVALQCVNRVALFLMRPGCRINLLHTHSTHTPRVPPAPP